MLRHFFYLHLWLAIHKPRCSKNLESKTILSCIFFSHLLSISRLSDCRKPLRLIRTFPDNWILFICLLKIKRLLKDNFQPVRNI